MTGSSRTSAARRAFLARFSSAEERKSYFAELGRRASEARQGGLVLTAEEAAALLECYAILGRAAERARRKLAAAGSPSGEEGGSDAQ